MSRARKLLIVGLVLLMGIGLAWPFRNTGPRIVPLDPVDARVQPALEVLSPQSPAPPAESVVPAARPVEQHISATMASTGDGSAESPVTSFDVENHPALAASSHNVPPKNNPFTKPTVEEARTARPAYTTGYASASEAASAEGVVHVVQNGDTLEKLAQRYLGDEARALELFDLNREQLSNPHLLPIGAELKIPIPPQRGID